MTRFAGFCVIALAGTPLVAFAVFVHEEELPTFAVTLEAGRIEPATWSATIRRCSVPRTWIDPASA